MSPPAAGRWRCKRQNEEELQQRARQHKLLALLHDTVLTGTYVGGKGETYELTCIDSEAGSTWSCMRNGIDGSTKKFTLWYDEETDRVWWGSWTYYFEPSEAAATGTINWYKLGPGKGFEWKREAQQAYSDEHPVQKVEEVEVPKKIKGYALGEHQVQPVSTDFEFKPPPGLEQPKDLHFFTELPGEVQPKEHKEKADDETSAGSGTPHETDGSESEDEKLGDKGQSSQAWDKNKHAAQWTDWNDWSYWNKAHTSHARVNAANPYWKPHLEPWKRR
ncbi:unnamed protein product [Effrenium voratum]|nr:unnamed protein product [Effrenium voratum]CAJ1423099.1 unnamed protein product [Effrenium voratum]